MGKAKKLVLEIAFIGIMALILIKVFPFVMEVTINFIANLIVN